MYTYIYIYRRAQLKISKWKCWLGYICPPQERGQNPPNVHLKFVWSGQNFPILAFWLPVLHTRGQIKDISLSKYRCTFLSLFLTSAIMILRRCMEFYIFVQDLKMKDDKRVKLQQDKDRTHQMFQHWNELSCPCLEDFLIMVSQHNFTAKSAAENSSNTCVSNGDNHFMASRTEIIHKRDILDHKMFVERLWIEGHRLHIFW